MNPLDNVQLDNVTAMYFLKDRQRIRQREWSDGNMVVAGDYTYAWGPQIKSWGEGARCIIGKYCSIAGNIQIFLGGDHRTDWITTYPFAELLPKNFPDIKGSPRSKGDVVIGNDVWIGNDAKIMSGVHIGDGAVIAGSAVVTHDVEPYSIVGGVPARHIRFRMPEERIQQLLELAWWDWDVEKVTKAVPILQSGDIDALIDFDRRWKDE